MHSISLMYSGDMKIPSRWSIDLTRHGSSFPLKRRTIGLGMFTFPLNSNNYSIYCSVHVYVSKHLVRIARFPQGLRLNRSNGSKERPIPGIAVSLLTFGVMGVTYFHFVLFYLTFINQNGALNVYIEVFSKTRLEGV